MAERTKLLLLDGDLILYSTLSAAEKDAKSADWSLTVDGDAIKENILRQIANLRDMRDDHHVVIAISDDDNFRKGVYAEYKANRKHVRKPVGYYAARKWLLTHPAAVVKPHIEADDVIGILATKPGNDALIVSIDKDMKSIPGTIMCGHSGRETVTTEDDADAWWLTQTLTGDQVDNYPGCPGIGAVKAAAILKKPGDRWENVVAAYRAAGLTEDDALVQARLARILRWEDWDSDKQRPRLWTPPAHHRPLQPGDGER